jgi:hypothetical protein
MSSTPAVSPSVTPTLTPSVSTSAAPSTYTIDYDFQQGADSGQFTITVNGSTVVNVTTNSSGQITVPVSAAIGTSAYAATTSPLIAEAGLIIYDAGTEIYNNSEQGTPSASDLHNYTATGNGTISATAYSF